jgi:hypothetical protein
MHSEDRARIVERRLSNKRWLRALAASIPWLALVSVFSPGAAVRTGAAVLAVAGSLIIVGTVVISSAGLVPTGLRQNVLEESIWRRAQFRPLYAPPSPATIADRVILAVLVCGISVIVGIGIVGFLIELFQQLKQP